MSINEDNALNDFEQSLAQLEAIVDKMEKGELSLEQSLEAFEEGVKLTRNCQQTLRKAEQRVHELLDDNGELSTKPFTSDHDGDSA
ncbi:exodeoxyribonuclease VII small subunit [Oleiphilus sp. HI0009]|uniref:exodeoxyribonuclease VII small subunit n=1 Tax=unclassified Oleiphilus TaxID=2631174 RepID=UPI0007C3163F|nr:MULTISPECIES: exodeoxyribonuclease VII small subunit [unclassified Oleiphilus]KZX71330.1 exodeoxyribonuclease VII small subunit [Oleiphilus sp. HI0009]MCH2159637.1 exodeoxyribonuclease VII small subunit [Oleiphilaceae bacterium]KZX81384.1 exodeoxyribonuclease VII small subunit [Oleiphilus sp. HI0009]KZY65780.1 exodeoxyribonuclease VII small subunit [Oleiphilus sp. HI0066]KZY75554.1 exodeoxyribonuclease VII small subunit [Oleiphilus sp. HI0067]